MKQVIKLNESDIHRMVKNAVSKYLRESYNDFDTNATRREESDKVWDAYDDAYDVMTNTTRYLNDPDDDDIHSNHSQNWTDRRCPGLHAMEAMSKKEEHPEWSDDDIRHTTWGHNYIGDQRHYSNDFVNPITGLSGFDDGADWFLMRKGYKDWPVF